MHRVGSCSNAVPAFPRSGCLDMDWSRLRVDGKIQDSGFIRESRPRDADTEAES